MTLTNLELQIRLIITALLILAILRWVIHFVIRTVAHIISSIQRQPLIHRQAKGDVTPQNGEDDILMIEKETVVLEDTTHEIRITQEIITTIEEDGITDTFAETKEAIEETNEEDGKLSPKEQKRFDELRIEAIAYKERGKLDLYEKSLIEALAIDPNNMEMVRMLGDHYFETGKYIKALSLLKKVVNEDPANHKAVWQIGQIYLNENQIETAKLLVEKAISLKDDNPKYYISLVEIYYQLGDIKEAIKALEKVLKLRPKNIEYLLGIATLHEENSEPSKAAYYYSKIIELDPMHDIAKSKLKVLHV